MWCRNWYNISGNLDGNIMVYFAGPIQVHHNKIPNIGKYRQTLGFERPEEMLGRCSGEGQV